MFPICLASGPPVFLRSEARNPVLLRRLNLILDYSRMSTLYSVIKAAACEIASGTPPNALRSSRASDWSTSNFSGNFDRSNCSPSVQLMEKTIIGLCLSVILSATCLTLVVMITVHRTSRNRAGQVGISTITRGFRRFFFFKKQIQIVRGIQGHQL